MASTPGSSPPPARPPGSGALAGLKVVDLTRVLGGPYCTQMLGDHGASVIKIEPPAGDETRDWGPPFRDGTASYFVGVNRNKRGLALDLARPRGREVLLRLLADADVLIENFKIGTLEKWGLGYEAVLAPRFPRLIHCRITGFGGAGPYAGMAGYDAVAQAMSGLLASNGPPERAYRIGIPLADLGAGLNAALGIVMAVVERQRSGRGQSVEVSLCDTGVSLLHPQAANWFMSGQPPQRQGDSHPNISPYSQFATRTGRVFLACGNDRQFRRLCAELGRPELADDARFRSNADRVVNRAALHEQLDAALANADGEALCRRLLEQGVPAGAVLDVPEVLNHPQTAARGMTVELPGGYRGTGIPIKLSRTPGSARTPPPPFGADGRTVLAEAGFSPAEIEALAAEGVLASERRRGE